MKEEIPFCRFHHRFVFWVSNLHEIVSRQVVNFHAGLQQSVNKDGFVWGHYELLIAYRRHNKDGELRQKRFSRGFIINVPYEPNGFVLGERLEAAGCLNLSIGQRFACEAEFSQQITPLFPQFFPLFSRLSFVLFKIVVHVYGKIGASQGEKPVAVAQLVAPAAGERAVEPLRADAGIAGPSYYQDKADNKEILDLDLLALQQKKEPAYQKPAAGPQSNQLFYQMLLRHQEELHDLPKGKKEQQPVQQEKKSGKGFR
jgi:hypothetical protein